MDVIIDSDTRMVVVILMVLNVTVMEIGVDGRGCDRN